MVTGIPHLMLQSLLCAVLLLAGGGAWAAQVVGVVAHLSGPLLDRKADGSVKVLGPKSEVESGDTLVAEKNTYAQIRFVDNSEITLKPGTTFRIENFSYDADKPDADSAAFSLVKGGLRSITGLLGKRNKEKFSLKTPSATIGIRGTTFIAQWVEPPSTQAVKPGALAPPGLVPGLHLQVTDGMIVVTNSGGSQGFQAGQFGYVPSVNQMPVIVPPHPNMQFVPPPAFSVNPPTGPQASGAGASSSEKQGVDCVVR
jgi:hypothetical protein